MAKDKAAAIYASGLTIYDPLQERPDLYLETALLEKILNQHLIGFELDFPIRTRSKVVRQEICKAMGYPVPATFQKTRPRFPGQNFDTYVQKSNNLQIWNEEISASRRYALIRVDQSDRVTKVRVITGAQLALLDSTKTLTSKYQARSKLPVKQSHLVSKTDTANLVKYCVENPSGKWPGFKRVADVYTALQSLVGTRLRDPGNDQERNRGAELHASICKALGYEGCRDDGQFPDLTEQLIEIKLQTATTVDLGLVRPNSTDRLSEFPLLRHCDVRYALFYGTIRDQQVELQHLVLTPGANFFDFFQRFEGNVVNKKNQIELPDDFFGE